MKTLFEQLQDACKRVMDTGNKPSSVRVMIDDNGEPAPLSCTNPEEKDQCDIERDLLKNHKDKPLNPLRGNIRSPIYHQYAETINKLRSESPHKVDMFERIWRQIVEIRTLMTSTQQALTLGYGNCAEHTANALLKLLEIKKMFPDFTIHVVKMFADKFEHMAILINSSIPDGHYVNPQEIKSLLINDNALECDPWNDSELQKVKESKLLNFAWNSFSIDSKILDLHDYDLLPEFIQKFIYNSVENHIDINFFLPKSEEPELGTEDCEDMKLAEDTDIQEILDEEVLSEIDDEEANLTQKSSDQSTEQVRGILNSIGAADDDLHNDPNLKPKLTNSVDVGTNLMLAMVLAKLTTSAYKSIEQAVKHCKKRLQGEKNEVVKCVAANEETKQAFAKLKTQCEKLKKNDSLSGWACYVLEDLIDDLEEIVPESLTEQQVEVWIRKLETLAKEYVELKDAIQQLEAEELEEQEDIAPSVELEEEFARCQALEESDSPSKWSCYTPLRIGFFESVPQPSGIITKQPTALQPTQRQLAG